MSFPNPCEMKMRCFTQSSSSADILKYQLPASFHSFGKETVQSSTKNPFEFQKTGFSGLLSLPVRLWVSHLTSQDLIYTRNLEVLLRFKISPDSGILWVVSNWGLRFLLLNGHNLFPWILLLLLNGRFMSSQQKKKEKQKQKQ